MELRFMQWIASWLDVFCGTISVLTLTFYRPKWEFTFRVWFSKRRMEKLKLKEKNE